MDEVIAARSMGSSMWYGMCGVKSTTRISQAMNAPPMMVRESHAVTAHEERRPGTVRTAPRREWSDRSPVALGVESSRR